MLTDTPKSNCPAEPEFGSTGGCVSPAEATFYGDNYFILHSQQLTYSPAQLRAIFIMGVGMSIRYGAWVFGGPWSFDN